MLTISVDSSQGLNLLDGLAHRISNLSPVMVGIGQELQSRVSSRFETETDPSGHPWADWAPSTIATYPEDGNRRILDRYGDMLASLNYQSDTSSSTVGFGNLTATYHEWGTKRMPRRGMLFDDPDVGTLAPNDERAVLEMLSDFIGAF